MKRVAVPIRDLNANLQVILNNIKAMKYEKVALRKKKKVCNLCPERSGYLKIVFIIFALS